MAAYAAPKSNFCLNNEAVLYNDRIKLVPFEASRHLEEFAAQSRDHPELWAHMPGGPFSSAAELSPFIAAWIADPSILMYAMIDKTRPGSAADPDGALAGLLTYMHTERENRSTEIGLVVVLPPFQRSHVTTGAVGLMLQHAFRPVVDGGLGLLRVTWMTSTANVASQRVAERFGFRREGVFKWHRLFKDGKLKSKVGNGLPLPPGSGENDVWRDTVASAITWDDWADGVEERVKTLLERTK